jgi:hypothetical protein
VGDGGKGTIDFGFESVGDDTETPPPRAAAATRSRLDIGAATTATTLLELFAFVISECTSGADVVSAADGEVIIVVFTSSEGFLGFAEDDLFFISAFWR